MQDPGRYIFVYSRLVYPSLGVEHMRLNSSAKEFSKSRLGRVHPTRQSVGLCLQCTVQYVVWWGTGCECSSVGE